MGLFQNMKLLMSLLKTVQHQLLQNLQVKEKSKIIVKGHIHTDVLNERDFKERT